jgi:predicted acylesterase/phospholipase RssA
MEVSGPRPRGRPLNLWINREFAKLWAGQTISLRAVTSSIAVPGVVSPVPIDGRRYMDGGMRSPGNADVLAGTGVRRAVRVPLRADGVGGRGDLREAVTSTGHWPAHYRLPALNSPPPSQDLPLPTPFRGRPR